MPLLPLPLPFFLLFFGCLFECLLVFAHGERVWFVSWVESSWSFFFPSNRYWPWLIRPYCSSSGLSQSTSPLGPAHTAAWHIHSGVVVVFIFICCCVCPKSQSRVALPCGLSVVGDALLPLSIPLFFARFGFFSKIQQRHSTMVKK